MVNQQYIDSSHTLGKICSYIQKYTPNQGWVN